MRTMSIYEHKSDHVLEYSGKHSENLEEFQRNFFEEYPTKRNILQKLEESSAKPQGDPTRCQGEDGLIIWTCRSTCHTQERLRKGDEVKLRWNDDIHDFGHCNNEQGDVPSPIYCGMPRREEDSEDLREETATSKENGIQVSC